MNNDPSYSKEIFSFHLAKLPLWSFLKLLLLGLRKFVGLEHSEVFLPMGLGQSIASPRRYGIGSVALFAWWKEESALDEFLAQPSSLWLRNGWHVRMKLYRRWGAVSEIKNADVAGDLAQPPGPIVAVTLARLNLVQTFRFIRWGKPVERQVRDDDGQVLALAGLRPLTTFSTFSIWKSEAAMIRMVHGESSHKEAMRERLRKDFHHEFTTMRFVPLAERGEWNGRSVYCFVKDT